jgi:hypothetical protein
MGRRPAALYTLVALGLSLASPDAVTAVPDESGTQKVIDRISAGGGVLVPVRDGRVGGGAPAPSISHPPAGGGSVYRPAPPPSVYHPTPPSVYHPTPPSVYRPAPPSVYRPVPPPSVYRPVPPPSRTFAPLYHPAPRAMDRGRRHHRRRRSFGPGFTGWGYDTGGSCYWNCRSAGYSAAYCRAHAWNFCY